LVALHITKPLWTALEERDARADLERHPVALRIDAQLALAVVRAVVAGLHNIASTAVCGIGCPAN